MMSQWLPLCPLNSFLEPRKDGGGEGGGVLMLFPGCGLGPACPGHRSEGGSFLSRTLMMENCRQLELVMESQKMSGVELNPGPEIKGFSNRQGYTTVTA